MKGPLSMICSHLARAAACAALLAYAAPAFAQSAPGAAPAFVGTWALEAAQCTLPQDNENAPLIMRANGYQQQTEQCSFTSVKPQKKAWAVKGSCSIEGKKEPLSVTLSLVNGELNIDDGTGVREFKRCP
ncbi:MAG: hypothetical protein Q7T81_02645 [Pseudolabrys sp.]|nr:hypothetical protein [Pseudolabrys sp.]